jgi:nitrogen fixation/metabolism regulation signal transduction histidine kinase
VNVHFSTAGRLSLVLSVLLMLIAALGAGLGHLLEPWWLAWLLPMLVALPLLWFAIHRIVGPAVAVIRALTDSAESFRDKDFSVSVAADRRDELGKLITAHNRLGSVFRLERQTLFQRELLLDTVIQTTDIALVLSNFSGQIVYSNAAARELFNTGQPINGSHFSALLEHVHGAFAEAVAAGKDGLFTYEDDEPHTYHLSQDSFTLNAQPHRLFLFKQLTQELSRQEVATWKKVIRVISHELNNSLAPISSLAYSGKKLVSQNKMDSRLDTIFATIGERSSHLKNFIESYARFARLPTPRLEQIDWPEFMDRLKNTVAFELSAPLPEIHCRVDPAQFEQVLINLLKNAHESGSPVDKINVTIVQRHDLCIFAVTDEGGGISDEVMQSALLPFYSTKKSGAGLGLPLCREIVEAHGGRLSLLNVGTHGLQVTVSLPSPTVQEMI